MAKTLKLVIEADAKTEAIKVVSEDLQRLDETIKKAGAGLDGFVTKLKKIGGAIGGIKLVGDAFTKVLHDGLAFNRMMEEQSNGIRSLIVATSENFDSLGRQLSIQQKYNLAQKEALETMRELNRINAMTPHTLDQTAQIYKALYANAKRYGATQKQMVEMTKLISIAAGNAGIEFQQLLASVDGLANGTFEANSEMGRFLSSIGLAPAKLRELAKEGKSVETVLNTLKDFDFDAGTMGQSLSNLSNAWSQFAGNITQSIFDDIKPALDSLADWINNLNIDIFGDPQKNRLLNAGVFELNGIDEINKKAQLLYSQIEEIDNKLKNGVGLWDTFFGDSEINLKDKKAELERQLKDLADTVGTYTNEAIQGQAKLISSSINTSVLEGMKIASFSAIDDVMGQMAEKFNNLTKNLKPNSKAYNQVLQVYNKEMARLTKQATKLWETEEQKKARASEAAAKRAAAAYKKMLSNVQKLNETITKDWMKATSSKTEFDLFNLETSYANKFKKIEELEKQALQFHKGNIAKQLEADKKLLSETFEKQRLDVIYKSQDAEMKLWEDYYKLIGDKEIAIEIEKAVKRNEIVDKYGKILNDEQLKLAMDASDKMIEAQRKAASEAVKIWQDAAKEINNSFENSLANLFKTGSIRNSFKSFIDGMADSLSKAMAKAVMTGTGSFLDNLIKGFNTGFDAMSGDYTKLLTSFGLSKATAGILGKAGAAGTVAYGAGNILDNLAGTRTNASDYAAAGAALGSIVPGIGTVAGGITGGILGGLTGGKWEQTNSGINFQGFDNITEWERWKKDRWFGFNDKHRTITKAAGAEIVNYFKSIEQLIAQIDSAIDGANKFALKGKIAAKDLDKKVGEAILGTFKTEYDTVGSSHGILGITIGKNQINKMLSESIKQEALAKFEAYAKSIDKTIVEAISQSFKFEKGMIDSLDINLEGAFGDLGKQISKKISDSFKNSMLKTPIEFDADVSDMLLKGITGFSDKLKNAVETVMIKFNGVITDVFNVDHTSEITANFEKVKSAWENWARQTGQSVVEAINAGLETIKVDKAQFENFFNDYFDLNGSIEVLRQKALDAGQKLKEAFDTVGQSFNLQNFQKIRDEALKGFNFTPENIQNWHEAQTALENAATATKSFVDALKGMIGEFDGVISGFDAFINKLRGIDEQQNNVIETTLKNVLDTISKLQVADKTNEILDLSKQTLSEVQGFKATLDNKLQEVASGAQQANDKLIAEITNTLKVGLSETLKDIQLKTGQLDEAKKLGDTDAINRLTEEINRLNSEKAEMTAALNKLSDGTLTKGIATEIQGALDKAIAQIAEMGKDKAVTEQQALISELQAQTAILSSIEGLLSDKQANGDQILQDAINNLADSLKNDQTAQTLEALPENIAQSIQPISQTIETIPDAITQSMNGLTDNLAATFEQVGQGIAEIPNQLGTAMQPLNDMMSQLPDTFNSALQPLGAALDATNQAIATLPDAFNASMEPVATAVTELPNAFNTALAPLNESISLLPDTFNAALQPVTESIAMLPESFNAAMAPMIDSMGLVNESIKVLPESFNTAMQPMIESVKMLPESFSAALQPVTATMEALPATIENALAPVAQSIDAMTASMANIAPEMASAVSNALAPVSAAVSQMSGSIGQLVAAENATTSAVYSAGSQIASAVGGLRGMIEGAAASARAATEAAKAAAQAANGAKEAAASATAKNADLAASMDKLAAVNYANGAAV